MNDKIPQTRLALDRAAQATDQLSSVKSPPRDIFTVPDQRERLTVESVFGGPKPVRAQVSVHVSRRAIIKPDRQP